MLRIYFIKIYTKSNTKIVKIWKQFSLKNKYTKKEARICIYKALSGERSHRERALASARRTQAPCACSSALSLLRQVCVYWSSGTLACSCLRILDWAFVEKRGS